MLAYKKYVTIDDPSKLVLTDLPFNVGQRVEILVIADDDATEKRVEQVRQLFRATQALPQVQSLTTEEIESEIANYRAEH